MAKLGHDFSTVEANGSDFAPLPEGNYVVRVTDSEVKQTKAGDGSFLKIEFTVADGEFEGRKLWDNYMLTGSKSEAIRVGLSRLKSLALAAGHKNPNGMRDSEELHGLLVLATVKTEENLGYAPQSKIKNFSDPSPHIGSSRAETTSPGVSAAKKKRPWEK